MRRAQDLNIYEWQEYMTQYRAEHHTSYFPALRIENTPFTVGRYAGGMVYRDEHYTYFEPRAGGINPDGSPVVAWLMVRDDFRAWVEARLRAEDKAAREARKKAQEAAQGDLFADAKSLAENDLRAQCRKNTTPPEGREDKE